MPGPPAARLIRLFGSTRRQQVTGLTIGAFGALTVAVALAGSVRCAVAGLAVLLTLVLLVLLDVRGRVGRLERRLRTAPRPAPAKATTGKVSAQTDRAMRRILASVEAGRLDAADQHAALLAALAPGQGRAPDPTEPR